MKEIKYLMITLLFSKEKYTYKRILNQKYFPELTYHAEGTPEEPEPSQPPLVT